ncbi:hypothetical protein [Natronoglycomyces albus]|uniref:Uncharacterized protein n=1 Tax=Natronoglycomyces albus TaxID=2811108 RepID=A0A895XP40_9ACTN|nr:hypothetical protein [Natronoglycomyces albus]QSB04060.1 hypothetical protein JQS30_09530 [Natronoglycomyces albus]
MQKPGSKRRQRLLLVGSSALLVGAIAVVTMNMASAQQDNGEQPHAAASCFVEELPYPDDSYMSFATAMDSTGAYIAGRTYPSDPEANFERQVLIWHEGDLTRVDISGEDQLLGGINSSGDGAGSTYVDFRAVPILYRDGVVSELPYDREAAARDINDEGVVVGSNDAGQGRVPVYWEADATAPVELELPEGYHNGDVFAIDEEGTKVGFVSRNDSGNRMHYLWTNEGEGIPLPMPNDASPTDGFAADITAGWVTGPVWNGDQAGASTVRWQPGDLAPETKSLEFVSAINELGWIAGHESNRAAFANEAGVHTLPSIIDDPTATSNAIAISGDGAILAGNAETDPTEVHSFAAVRWTCQ